MAVDETPVPPRRLRRLFTDHVAAAVGAALLAAAASCSHDSFLIVSLTSADTAFVNLTRITVQVTSEAGDAGAPSVSRTFFPAGSDALSIDTAAARTLSVSFTPDRSGPVDLTIDVFDAAGCAGLGSARATIDKGGVARVAVALLHTRACAGQDAGVDAAADGAATFPGCDPAQAGSCPGTEACNIDCTTASAACVAGGTKAQGETCAADDCMPGAQCFGFSCGASAGAQVCVKLCAKDADCASVSTAVATSTCRDPVICPGTDPATGATTSTMTTYRTCGFPCDPRGDGTLGCPTNLFCFLYQTPAGGQDTPNCGCRPPTRIGVEGATCASSTDCAPGLLCNVMGGTESCRRLCKMSAPADCGVAEACTALTNNTVFGVCLATQ